MFDDRLSRYAAVGAANTLAGLTVIFAAKALAGLGDAAANAIGYAVGVSLGFVLNRSWTFRYEGDALGALLRYVLVLLAAYAANLLTVLFAIDELGLDSYLAQAVGVLPYVLVGYAGSRRFAFARRTEGLR